MHITDISYTGTTTFKHLRVRSRPFDAVKGLSFSILAFTAGLSARGILSQLCFDRIFSGASLNLESADVLSCTFTVDKR